MPLSPPTSCSNHFAPYVLDHQTHTADGVVRMFEANGSGPAAGDLDGDGDLDLVFGAYEGQDAIFWNDGPTQWRKAPFSDGTFYRDVRAASGYLSGDPSRVHFGLPADAQLLRLEITWPDGEQTTVTDIVPGERITIERK